MSRRSDWHTLRERRMAEPGAADAYEAARLAFELGRRVRELREQRGWNQTQLARQAGMAKSAVARFEAGGHDRAHSCQASRPDSGPVSLGCRSTGTDERGRAGTAVDASAGGRWPTRRRSPGPPHTRAASAGRGATELVTARSLYMLSIHSKDDWSSSRDARRDCELG